MLSDASRSVEKGQLGFIGGLMFRNLRQGSIFHTITWGSHLAERPTISTGSAEILACSEAISEGQATVGAYQTLLIISVHLCCIAESKDLWSTLSTCRVPEDKSIRANVGLIRYQHETHQINQMVWFPGSVNLADPLTNPNSPVTTALLLNIFMLH